MRLKFCLIVLAGLGWALGCGPVRAQSPDDVTFFDSISFDKELADQLQKQPSQAQVVPSAPFSPNQIPVRLEKWISVVSKAGGTVKLQKLASGPASRGILADLVDLSIKAHDESELTEMYAVAKSYNVIVSYNGSDVVAVRFVKRPDPQP